MTIDVNVSLSRWPFRRLPLDELRPLIQKLHAVGVTQAWVGSFDGLFHKDLDGVNARLTRDCELAPRGLLRPFGTVNPMLPDWREDLRRCHEVHHMPGIRLHPNYHGYQLDNPRFAELLALAAARGLIVQMAVRMEDPRMQHPLARVKDVDTAPLANLVTGCPGLQLMLLNAVQSVRGNALKKLVATNRVFFEIATLEGMAGIARTLKQMPLSLLLFGSHSPYFVIESALLKLRESPLTDAQKTAICNGNASRVAKPA